MQISSEPCTVDIQVFLVFFLACCPWNLPTQGNQACVRPLHVSYITNMVLLEVKNSTESLYSNCWGVSPNRVTVSTAACGFLIQRSGTNTPPCSEAGVFLHWRHILNNRLFVCLCSRSTRDFLFGTVLLSQHPLCQQHWLALNKIWQAGTHMHAHMYTHTHTWSLNLNSLGNKSEELENT